MADLGEQHPGSHASSLITLRSFVDVHIYVCVQSVTRGRDVSGKIGYFFFRGLFTRELCPNFEIVE